MHGPTPEPGTGDRNPPLGRRRGWEPGPDRLIRTVALLAVLSIAPGCGDRPAEPPEARPGPTRAKTLAEAIAMARAGDTVVIPAGTYDAGFTVPPGVTVRGAGMGRTILDARRVRVGLTIVGGRGAEVSDLTVRGARLAGVLVRGASHVSLRRIRATANLDGILFDGVERGRIENAICDGNRDGIILAGGRDNAVVNCTVTRNREIGLALPSGAGPRAFNNCLTENAIGVTLGAGLSGEHLDHNVYSPSTVGRVAKKGDEKTLGAWRAATGQDPHSIQRAVLYRNPGAGDYRPSAAPDGATIDHGTEVLAATDAPDLDADGAPRYGRCDVGAYEVVPGPLPVPRK